MLWEHDAVGSSPATPTKSGPVIDTKCRLPVRFILSRKALQIGRFHKTAGAFEASSEGENEPFFALMDLTWWYLPEAHILSFQKMTTVSYKESP